MRTFAGLLLSIVTVNACAQAVNGDFEEGNSFDPTGIMSYCSPELVQGWPQTHAASSLFAAAIPSRQFFNCPDEPPLLTLPSMAIQLIGLVPGQTYQINYWTAATTTDYEACFLAINYSIPATGILPVSETDLVNITGGLINPTTSWVSQSFPFTVPNYMPPGADVFAFFTFQQSEGSPTGDYLLIDDITLTGDLSTVIPSTQPASTSLSLDPTNYRLRVEPIDQVTSGSAIDALGRSTPLQVTLTGGDQVELDISGLSNGTYLLQINTRTRTVAHRFIKL